MFRQVLFWAALLFAASANLRMDQAALEAVGTWLGAGRGYASTLFLVPEVGEFGSSPDGSDVVEIYEPRSGRWFEGRAEDVELGMEILHAGHLYRVGRAEMLDLGSVDILELADADVAAAEVGIAMKPLRSSWVLVLSNAGGNIGHARLANLSPGDRFAFQGRIYEAFGSERVEQVRETGEVLGRVVSTFVRTADAVIEADITYTDGSKDTLIGTPNHPFWVPAEREYVALEDLRVGTVLRTYGGQEATVLGLTWGQGGLEVHDVEIEALHNFFVRGTSSDAAGVLVHNSGGPRLLTETPRGNPNTARTDRTFVTDPDGNTLIVPEGGGVTGSPDGSYVQTRRADGSISQRKDQAHRPPAAGDPPSSQAGTAPHGHGMDAGGNSLDVNGDVVDRTSPEAHWDAR